MNCEAGKLAIIVKGKLAGAIVTTLHIASHETVRGELQRLVIGAYAIVPPDVIWVTDREIDVIDPRSGWKVGTVPFYPDSLMRKLPDGDEDEVRKLYESDPSRVLVHLEDLS